MDGIVEEFRLDMLIPIFQVDAFASAPFAGNPAAVCLLPETRDARWMQHVAAEMNLSETAFLLPRTDGFDLRWFTPTIEVDLCGHATLASAHVLWETGRLSPAETARFHTRSGLLSAVAVGTWIELDFPVLPEEEAQAPPGLREGLGASLRYIGRNKFGYLVELDSEEEVRNLKPDFNALRTIPGVIVTSRSQDRNFDFVSRFFAPAAGVDEDPVTGSAHCSLAPFWSRRLNKKDFMARQVSARGGLVKVRLDGDRVRLGGQAVTVFRGEVLV